MAQRQHDARDTEPDPLGRPGRQAKVDERIEGLARVSERGHVELASGALVRVLPGLEVDDRSVLWLAYPKSNVLTAKVRVFIDFLVERIGRAPPWLRTHDWSSTVRGAA